MKTLSLLILCFLTVALCAGCAGHTEIKTLEVEKAVAVEIMIAAYQANKAGLLKDEAILSMEKIYNKWRATHMEAVEIMNSLSKVTDSGKQFKLDMLLKEAGNLLKNLQDLAALYNLGVAK